MMRKTIVAAVIALTLAAGSRPLSAQDYPSRPVRVVIPFAPGAGTDLLGRLVASELTQRLGQQFFVENKPGAAAQLGTDLVAKSSADGYTLLWTVTDGLSVLPAVKASVPYKIPDDFAFIAGVSQMSFVVSINAKVPIKSMAELIAYAKANPGKLFNASAGYASAPHLASVLFEAVAGVKFTHIQFKGGGPATQSLLAGDTQVNFATAPTVMGFVRAGRIRALAVSIPHASPAVPGIPGAEDAGLPGYEYTFWFGLYLPAGTPPPIVERLHAAMVKGLAKPDVQAKLALQGMDATPDASPAAFAAHIKREAPQLEKLVRDSGAKVE